MSAAVRALLQTAPRGVESLRALAAKTLSQSTAPETEVTITATNDGFVRFGADTVTTAGDVQRVQVVVTAAFGERAGTATTEDVTPDGIARAVRQASDIAKLLPPSPERLPVVKAQRYPVTFAWDAAAAARSSAARAARVSSVLQVARDAGLIASGFHRERERITVFVNSAGANGAHKGTEVDLSCTLRTPDGKQSGYAGASSPRLSEVDAVALAKRAAEKATRWKDPVDLPPGRYTAVLESHAVQPLVGYLTSSLDRRSADEGRSAFAAPGGRTRLGETLFAPGLSLGSDPSDRRIPGVPWGEGGLAAQRFDAISDGKLVALPVSRYWAKKNKLQPTPHSGSWSLAMAKTEPGLDALIKGTERGILVTRLWYVRMLSPQTITVTGLTRDATFLIEGGEVTSPVKNFRVNQSLLDLLRNVEAATLPEPASAGSSWNGVPAIRVKDVLFSSGSDAV